MKKEFVDKLQQEYPSLFARQIEPTCRDGWYSLIHNLCDILNTHIEYTYSEEIKGQFCISQIKEKFGGLRFYMNHEDEYMTGAITMAESYSDILCEVCGSPGSKRTIGGWIQTLCNSDHERLSFEHHVRMRELAKDIGEKKAKK